MEDTGSQGFVERLLEVITSPFALWVYSWIGIVLVLLVAVLIAVLQLRVIEKFNQAKILKRYRGREPEKPEAIERRIADLRTNASGVISNVTRRSGIMVASGVLVPASMLIFVAWYQPWFIAGSPALLVVDEPTFATELSLYQLGVFATDQALRGGLSDLFEVFGLGITPISNNPDNLIFSGLVMGFRMICQAVVIAIALLLLRVGLGMRHLRLAIAKLEGDRDEAHAAHA